MGLNWAFKNYQSSYSRKAMSSKRASNMLTAWLSTSTATLRMLEPTKDYFRSHESWSVFTGTICTSSYQGMPCCTCMLGLFLCLRKLGCLRLATMHGHTLVYTSALGQSKAASKPHTTCQRLHGSPVSARKAASISTTPCTYWEGWGPGKLWVYQLCLLLCPSPSRHPCASMSPALFAWQFL